MTGRARPRSSNSSCTSCLRAPLRRSSFPTRAKPASSAARPSRSRARSIALGSALRASYAHSRRRSRRSRASRARTAPRARSCRCRAQKEPSAARPISLVQPCALCARWAMRAQLAQLRHQSARPAPIQTCLGAPRAFQCQRAFIRLPMQHLTISSVS